MKSTDSNSLPGSVSPGKLLSVLLLATGMLLASTMTMKASWLWVLAPITLLFVLDASGGPGRKIDFSAVPFYLALLGVALAFHFFGPSSPVPQGKVVTAQAAAGCGVGGCGTTGGCGTSGCGASAGGGCGCSSSRGTGKTATSHAGRKAPASPSANPIPPPTAAVRPVAPTPPKRNLNLQLPPAPALPPTPGASGASPPAPTLSPGSATPPAPQQ